VLSVTADTNIYVSAFNYRGKPREFINLANAGVIRLDGFYLITLKGSQQAGLTGLKGSIVRKVAVDKTRSSLERALATIKQNLEAETE
jgi:hypothetical protein